MCTSPHVCCVHHSPVDRSAELDEEMQVQTAIISGPQGVFHRARKQEHFIFLRRFFLSRFFCRRRLFPKTFFSASDVLDARNLRNRAKPEVRERKIGCAEFAGSRKSAFLFRKHWGRKTEKKVAQNLVTLKKHHFPSM